MAKERWATRVGLVLAMAGNAVGLGNFLRFPAQVAQNGGGAFMIPYIVALLVMGLPLIWVEWSMGRYGGQHGHHSAPGILQSMSRNPFWKYFGVFGLWTNLMVAAYYLYIESWCLIYAFYSYLGGFLRESPGDFFDRMLGTQPHSVWAISPWGIGAFFLCIVINIWILSRGLAKGIEVVAKIGMPLLIGFALILAVRGLFITQGKFEFQLREEQVQELRTEGVSQPVLDRLAELRGQSLTLPQLREELKGVLPEATADADRQFELVGKATVVAGTDRHAQRDAVDGLNYVWKPQYDKLWSPSLWLAAAGQIFFTLSIGLGSIHCYASYLREMDDVTLTGSSAAWTNEFCEVILGGTILIPIAMAYMGMAGVEKAGFGMAFTTLPTLFNHWGAFAPFAGFLWFGLLFFAAITSSLAMGQPIMAFFQDEFRISRARSALLFGLILLPLAGAVAITHSSTFMDEFDFWAGTFALVIFAFGETILFAWIFGMNRGWAEMMKGAELRVPKIFYFILKFVTPVFLGLILVGSVFQPKGEMTVPDKDPETGEVRKDPATGKELTKQENLGWEPYVKALFRGESPPEWEWSPGGLIGMLMHKDLNAALEKSLRDPKTDKEKAIKFNRDQKLARYIDRAVMVGVYLFFCILVWIAWQKRARNSHSRESAS